MALTIRMILEADCARIPAAFAEQGWNKPVEQYQILYATRGYVPDGRGLFWRGQPCKHGDQVVVDDDLALYLTRRLR